MNKLKEQLKIYQERNPFIVSPEDFIKLKKEEKEEKEKKELTNNFFNSTEFEISIPGITYPR